MVLISAHVEIAVVGGNTHAAVCGRQFLPLRKSPSRTMGFVRQRFMVSLLLLGARLKAELADQIGRVCLEVRPLLGMALLGL